MDAGVKHVCVHMYLYIKYYDKLHSHTDLSPISVRSATKSYITSWCSQNLPVILEFSSDSKQASEVRIQQQPSSAINIEYLYVSTAS